MYKMILVAFLILFSLQKSYGYGNNRLPSYIKACSKSDPKFNECAIEHGQAAISHIVQGDDAYLIPSFMPFKIDYVNLEASEMVKVSVTNLTMMGYDGAIIKNIDWNFDKKLIKLHVTIPSVNCKGIYNLNGRILIMSFHGNGLLNTTFYNTNMHGESTYVINKFKNKEYMQLDKITVKIDHQKVIYQFDNLLNNEEMSKKINQYINENWKIFQDEINPSMEEILISMARSIINPFLKKIPLEYILLP